MTRISDQSKKAAMASILSTKKLSAAQKEIFQKASITFTDYDAIQIDFIDFQKPVKTVENAIFTSKNAVKSVFKDSAFAKSIQNCFCVGEKTAYLLLKNGKKPIKTAENAAELADFIAKNHPEKEFYFFCSDKRREELPNILNAEKVTLNEIITYKTSLNVQQIDQDFDAVLFFSPSGIQSFVENNDLSQKMAVCIGKTTASEAKKYTDKIEIASETTVESVIEKAVDIIEIKKE